MIEQRGSTTPDAPILTKITSTLPLNPSSYLHTPSVIGYIQKYINSKLILRLLHKKKPD